MDDVLTVGVRQGCRLRLFLFVFLLHVNTVTSFDLNIRPQRLDWVLEGTSLEFTCSFKNRNPPEYVVWKNGVRTIGSTVFGNACAVLKLDPQIDLDCDASSSKLHIPRVRSRDTWSIHCHERNGTARSRSVKVKILHKSKLILSPKTNSLVKEEGSSATITCRAEGQGHYTDTYPSFSWFNDGLRVVQTTYTSSGRCLTGDVVTPPNNMMTSCGTFYSRVNIRNISLDDAGLWHCGYGPPHFGMKSQPIKVIVEKKVMTTTDTSTAVSPTTSSQLLGITSVSGMTSPISTTTFPTTMKMTLPMSTNERTSSTVTSTSSTTPSSTTTVTSNQPSTLSTTTSTTTSTTSYPRSKPTSTALPTTSTVSSTTTMSMLTTVSMSTKTSTSSSTTSLLTFTPSSTPFTLTSASTSISMPPSTSSSTSKPTPSLASPEPTTATNDDLSTVSSKLTVYSFPNILTTSTSTGGTSYMLTETSTSNLTGSYVTESNGTAREAEVALEGGITHISPILIGCIIAAVVVIIFIVVIVVVIIRRRRTQNARADNSDSDFRVEGWERQSWDTDNWS